MIELKVPRIREGFYPVILSLLKDQQQEAHNLAFELYKSGLTTEQVGGEVYLVSFTANITALAK